MSIQGKTCDVMIKGAKCGKPATNEFMAHGVNGVLLNSFRGYMCDEHSAVWKRSADQVGRSIGSNLGAKDEKREEPKP